MVDSTLLQRQPRVSGRTLVHCAQCREDLWLYASQIKLYRRHFCTRKCRDAYRASHHWGNPKKGKFRKCDECGAQIYRAPSRAAEYEHHFCDAHCRDQWLKKNRLRGSMRKCDQCGTGIRVIPAQERKYKRHFCGVECRNRWLSANTNGKNSSNFKGGNIRRRCAVCRKPFHAVRAEVGRGRAKCCSRSCFYKSRRKQHRIKCSVCRTPFCVTPYKLTTAKFCSRSCKHSAQVKQRTPREIAQRKLEVRIASLMGYSLKGRKAGCRWESLVGYTLKRLMSHLERKFASGMTWSNIGEWHIDHKRPRSTFTYDSPDDPEFKACWALKNLQPLWAVDNLRKGARLDWRGIHSRA